MYKKMLDNSDDHDFKPSGSSKLATLFNNPQMEDLNTSLTYTAPKQPKADKDLEACEPAKNTVPTTLLLAKVVSLWKLDNNTIKYYKMMGKHGLAVIGSIDLNLFEIIVYKEKNNILLRRKINSNCSFYNQKECFSSFYDNDNQNWLVKFESLAEQTSFCKEIENYGASIKNSEGHPPRKEKTPYTNDHLLSKPDEFPKPTPNKEHVKEEVHSDSSGSQKRANILSRMAKMGQHMLPNQVLKNKTPDASDSEGEEPKANRKIPPRKYKRAVHIECVSKEGAVEQHNHPKNQMIPSQINNLNYPTQFPPPPFNQLGAYDGFNHYIVTQNTELKMNLAQISAKLDNALSGNNLGKKYDDRTLKSKIKALELRSENLQAELQKYEERYQDLQKKYDDLQKRGYPKEKEDHKFIIHNLTEEMGKVKLDLKVVREKVINYETLERDIETYKRDITEHRAIIEMQRAKLKEFEAFYEENKENKQLQVTIDNLNDTVATLKLKLKDFKEYIQKTEEEKQKRVEDCNRIGNIFGDKIKKTMDELYQSILSNFNESSSYSAAQLKSVIAQNLKGTTFKIIEDFVNIYKNEAGDVLSESQRE